MQPSSRPRSSLARSTLINMGVRITLLIALSTLVSYFHIFHALRVEVLAQLERSVMERGQREQALFVLAEDNHATIKRALEERLRSLRQEEVDSRFDSLFASRPDGTIRNRPELYDGTRMPGVFVPRGVTADADFRRRLLASYDVIAQYGPAFHVRFTNTGIMLPEGVLVGYWPEGANYFQDLEATFSLKDFEYFRLGLPENNPRRETAWTGIFEDPPSQTWMITVATPFDMDGRHFGTISHDVLLNELMSRTLDDHLSGAYNLLFRDDGQLIAHPDMKLKSGAGVYNILGAAGQPREDSTQPGTPEQRAHLRAIFERVRERAPDQLVVELPEHDELLGVARLQGPGWNFVTVLPEQVVSSAAFRAARYGLFFGLAALLMELSIMYWVLKQQITRPLRSFTRATDRVAAGDFKVSLKATRDDELGQLAHGFELMAHELERREAALRQANEGLEHRIAERTSELREQNQKLEGALAQLKETQQLLVEKEKLASLGTLMAGIAHEIKNPLNFVNNFAQLSAGLMEELREELEAHQAGRSTALPPERLDELLSLLEQNVRKIDEHGRRADSIVQSMQLHARSAASEPTPTDLNSLLGEHLGLASGSMQVSHPDLEVVLRKELDPTVGKVDLVQQDFGRALLNVLNNSLYAVAEKKKSAGEGFTPEVTVSSRSVGPQVEIRIRDNGTGIPRKLHDKIFNPFFTTKPAGSGTGLGLSITYDIVVRQHQGELRISSTEGEYTECLILLPQSAVKA